ncbi:hypothetical protein R3P38DRAFT_3171671 [Favolaschia claudopus]|uniref:Uncharacterized protein n=1 Tax=Favolaschia claudopus TaxID=2862362 RepID=A0AAW0DRD3_9AGAR
MSSSFSDQNLPKSKPESLPQVRRVVSKSLPLGWGLKQLVQNAKNYWEWSTLTTQFSRIFEPIPSPLIELFLPTEALCDFSFYWSTLSPLERVVSRHRFFLDYQDATAFAEIDAIFWIGGRSSMVTFPLPSPATSKLLTLVNPEGRLKIVIVPEGERPIFYPHSPYTNTLTHNTISQIQSALRSQKYRPATRISLPILPIYRALMVASDRGTLRLPLPPTSSSERFNLIGDVAVKNMERAFWDSDITLMHRAFVPRFAGKSFKWRWYDGSMAGIYHGIPGWSRFTLGSNKGPWSTLATIEIGDDGDNVDNWDILLSILMSWSSAPEELRKFCLQKCEGSTRVGFVNQVCIGTCINGRYTPLAGLPASDTVYLFLENIRVGPDGYFSPPKRYWSLDQSGATPMSSHLIKNHQLDVSEDTNIHKRIQWLKTEQFAALDELQALLNDNVVNPNTSNVLQCSWDQVHPQLKRSQSVTRMQRIDWHSEWMGDESQRIREQLNRKRRRWFLKRRLGRFPPVTLSDSESEEEETKPKDPTRRLYRSRTKSVGGGLSLIFSRIVLS